MIKNLYILYDKNSMSVRLDGCFVNDVDALVSFLCRLPNFSGTVKSCEVRLIGYYDTETFDLSSVSPSVIPWSSVDLSTLPDTLVNNLKLAGAIPSDEKPLTFEFLDSRLTNIENALQALVNLKTEKK